MRHKLDVLFSIGSVIVLIGLVLGASGVLVRSEGPTYRLAILALAVILAFGFGTYSSRIARIARRLRRSPCVFVSYSSEDASKAKEIASLLRNAGAKVWIASEQIKPGQEWFRAVESAIRDANSLVVLLSRHTSQLIDREVQAAAEYKVPIIPVLLEPARVPRSLLDKAYIDLTSDPTTGLEALVEAST
jgi:hypothetical protein